MKRSGSFKNNFVVAFLLTPLIISCIAATGDWKELNLHNFTISVPSEWVYQKQQGEDSFTGHIIGRNLILSFDYSNHGFAEDIAPSDNEDEIRETKKTYHLKIDGNEKYIIKTIWPKTPGKGMTGIYIHSRKSSLSFQMSAKNLSMKDQELALQAFKTIKLKE